MGVSSPRARDTFDDLVSAGVSPTSPLDHYVASPLPGGAGAASAWRPEQPSTSEGSASAFTSWCALLRMPLPSASSVQEAGSCDSSCVPAVL